MTINMKRDAVNRLTERFFVTSAATFAPSDVAVAIPGTQHSLNGLIKRAAAEGDIIRIRRGLYCLAPQFRKKPVNTFAVAQQVYGPSYVSLETALSYHGWIMEGVFTCACICLKNGREFRTPSGVFKYTRVPQETLYTGVERCVDAHGNAFLMARPEKALADYVYVHKKEWEGIGQAAADMRIEPETIGSVTRDDLAVLIGNYRNKRVKAFLQSWEKDL